MNATIHKTGKTVMILDSALLLASLGVVFIIVIGLTLR